VREVLSNQPSETVDAVELMVSELATNSVRHARTDFELVIGSKGPIRVEVKDTGQGRPTLRSPAPKEPSGRGLRIVDAMSDTWGTIATSDGKTVWFELSAAPSPAGSSENVPQRHGSKQGKSARDGNRRSCAAHVKRLAGPLAPVPA
jgi:Histidine kinase-like ATPase domain